MEAEALVKGLSWMSGKLKSSAGFGRYKTM